jgi:elongation factor P
MITANELRKGMAIEMEGNLYQVVVAEHYKPGKGPAFVRSKLRNMDSGSIIDYKFRTDEKIERAILDERKANYLYRDSDHYVFMDNQTYEQVSFSAEQLGEVLDYLVENMEVTLTYHQERPISVEPPITVDMRVTQAEPGVKGDTASGGSKPVTVETGAVIQVPLFIEEGDLIRIDTRSHSYIERVKSR